MRILIVGAGALRGLGVAIVVDKRQWHRDALILAERSRRTVTRKSPDIRGRSNVSQPNIGRAAQGVVVMAWTPSSSSLLAQAAEVGCGLVCPGRRRAKPTLCLP
jgi:hypothetical protein